MHLRHSLKTLGLLAENCLEEEVGVGSVVAWVVLEIVVVEVAFVFVQVDFVGLYHQGLYLNKCLDLCHRDLHYY